MRQYSLDEKKLFLWKEKLHQNKTQKYQGVKRKLLEILDSDEALSIRKNRFEDYRKQLISDNHGQGWTWTPHFTWFWRFLSFFYPINYPQGSSLRKALLDDIEVSETRLALKDYHQSSCLADLKDDEFEQAIFTDPKSALADLKNRIEQLPADTSAMDIEVILNRLDAIKNELENNLYHLMLQKICKASPRIACSRLYALSQEAFEYPSTNEYIEINLLANTLLSHFVTGFRQVASHLNLGFDLLILLCLSDDKYRRKLNITGISRYGLALKTENPQLNPHTIYLELLSNGQLNYSSGDGLLTGTLSREFLAATLSPRAINTLFESLETEAPIHLGIYQRKILEAITQHNSAKLSDPLADLIADIGKTDAQIFPENSLRRVMRDEMADKLYEALDSQGKASREAQAMLFGQALNRCNHLQMLKDIFTLHHKTHTPPQNPLIYLVAKSLCEQLFIDYRQNNADGLWKEHEIGSEMIKLLQIAFINTVQPVNSFYKPADQEAILSPYNYPSIIPDAFREAEADAIRFVLNSGYSETRLLDSINETRSERRKTVSEFSCEWIISRIRQRSPALTKAVEHRLFLTQFYDVDDWLVMKKQVKGAQQPVERLMEELKEQLALSRIARESIQYENENNAVSKALGLLFQLLGSDSVTSQQLEEIYNYQLDKLHFYITHTLTTVLKNELKERQANLLRWDDQSLKDFQIIEEASVSSSLHCALKHLDNANSCIQSEISKEFVKQYNESRIAVYYFSVYMKQSQYQDKAAAKEVLAGLKPYLCEDQYKLWIMKLSKHLSNPPVQDVTVFKEANLCKQKDQPPAPGTLITS
ncbi:hypothetical protein Lqui_2899 [Legionella quinlivanii]|uniref:Uncharacterized protein n=1 Tax=Legionella quinlivanii TaxID=45073 RepID=A0A0W0XLW7_9GAMM|nr:hypothetical protein [Legionella quinlivanii]KTD45428.1 hypothetical protein Lqui_2899 [Legionella quinlivanii]SEG33886.1 hypothetical protein SAMN02746093_02587 [Legionella quinlivanii DSM 21216]STY10519.1 Uncharacterised protein [Legionella quinlivanii]